jgi:transcriptional regulator with XRE-family HTH domain
MKVIDTAAMKRFREQKNLSTGDVAIYAKIRTGLYENIESGKTNPPIVTLWKIARILGAKVDDLLLKDYLDFCPILANIKKDGFTVTLSITDPNVDSERIKKILTNAIEEGTKSA